MVEAEPKVQEAERSHLQHKHGTESSNCSRVSTAPRVDVLQQGHPPKSPQTRPSTRDLWSGPCLLQTIIRDERGRK